MTFRRLAEAAGTSPATLNAYERGRMSPTWSTFKRIARSVGFEPVIELVPALPPSAYPVGSLVGDLVAAPLGDRLRLVVEFVDRWSEVAPDQQVLLVDADPGSTGDPRWDALVGGIVEHLCWHAGRPAPSWVGQPSRFLLGRWWPVDLPTIRVASLADTPASLERRGVMLSRSSLERT